MINLYPNINNNDGTKQVSFNGLFSKKDKPEPYVLRYGQRSVLNGEASIVIPYDSIINFRNAYKIDLTKNPLKERIKNLKREESLIVGRVDINPNDLTVSRKQFALKKTGTNLRLTNISQYGTDFVLVNPNQTMAPKNFPKPVNVRQFNPFVNLNPQYLKSVYNKPQINFRELFDRKYNEIRIAKYTDASTFTGPVSYIQNAVSTPPRVGNIHQQSCWNYRYFQHGTSMHITDRVSMNVKADPRLIQELDKLMITGSYTDLNGRRCQVPHDRMVPGYYKTYSDASRWTSRHDPITMYFSGQPTPQMLNALCDISQKYARPSCNGMPLIGAIDGEPWISTEKEPQEEFLKPILAKAERLNPEMKNAVLSTCYERWDYQNGYRDFLVSAGQLDAIRFVLDEYEAYLKLQAGMRSA